MPVLDAHPGMARELRFFPIHNRHPRHLTRAQIAQFNDRGYIFPLDLLAEEETAAQRAYFDRLLAMATAAGRDNYAVNGWHAHCRGLYDLVCHPRMLDYVEDIVGPDIICIMTHYFSKNPTDSKTVYWHQDAQFWGITPSKVVTAWIAIDDVDRANGALQLFPRSHHRGVIPFEYVTDGENGVLNEHVHDPGRFGEPVAVAMRAGQFSLHTDMLLHGSMPNNSGRRRCGLTIRYMPPEVRYGNDVAEPRAVIARGCDPSGYWQSVPRPESDSLPPQPTAA
jgi:ectoine hydroxylase-related dioxygenase (phytanoyl-CoA dioxygenase family)